MKIIKDCIYRFIDVPPLCERFINTREFQRLRNVHQLGFVSYVYPSAVHTRFEHSLGVMHLAGVMLAQLEKTGVEISGRNKDLVQLAALYHDVGHGPFSHFMDGYGLPGPTHEERSLAILQEANKRLQLLTPNEVADVTQMITGNGDNFLYQIVHHPEGIDVDRLDYLQRDSYHCGMPPFQPDYIIKCAYVDAKTQNLCFLPKAEEEIARMLETRRRMFQTVYRHKTVLKVEEVVRTTLKKNHILVTLDMDDVDLMARLKTCPEYETVLMCREFHREKEP